MSDSRNVLKSGALTRRRFLKGSAAAAVSAGAFASLAACTPQGAGDGELAATDGGAVDGGTWISAACWHNCGGRCVNRVLVKDGKPVRQGSDTSHEDSFEWLQQRGCPRGRSQQQQCFGEDRLKYPMKRKSWQPGGGEASHGDLRGRDEWERISWDEAIDLIAGEVERIYGTYGPRAVIANYGPGVDTVLAKMGGYISISDTSSCGVYAFNMTSLGLPGCDLGETNDRFDNKNAETIVLMGGNSAWSSGGSTMNNFNEAKDAGVQFVYVGPSYNATAAYFDARWVPVYPGTDTAFLLGVAYEMIQQGVVDQEFLDKYCVGFDAAHMPADAKLDENFKDYLMGAYDGTPKTAEWASVICGTPVDDIKWFAETIGKDHAVMLLHNYALARCSSADNVPQLFMTVGAMGGHMGKSGHACGGAYKTFAGTNGPELAYYGDSGGAWVENPITDSISAPLLWQSILDGSFNSTGFAYSEEFHAQDIKQADIKYLSFEGSSMVQCTPDATTAIEAIRSMELVTCSSHFFNAQAKYADIVLPITTEWERVGGFPGHQRSRETVIVYTQVTDPLFEAKTDQEIGMMLSDRLGLPTAEMWPLSEKQQFFNQILGAGYMDETGEYVPLVTVTQEDIDQWGCEGEPQEGAVELAKFLSDGCFTVRRSEGDSYGYIGYADYIADPEANPRPSASGKFEIYCQYKADTLNSMGYSPDGTFKPYPTYVEAPEGREGMFADRAVGGAPSEYPFIVYNPHYLRRAHPVLDNAPWLREAWPNPVFISATDAAARGVADGDTVRVYNAHGSTLRTASVTEILMPGCVGLPHGAWMDYDEDEGVDRAGMDNMLCGSVTSGMGTSGYNNYNCNFEKYDGEALVPDCELPQRIVNVG
ncbi:molybdopterin-dependent oxidoreductase [Adlercreutzia sp. R7]|uniref:Molybdopterin-dependent oxidoreductase n=1 Tax=Adlercreutzia wanghongyangiae TaxID=3111451 RepID=A0ABU6IJ48_9ACTN|nr:molybdopterin-dependent oxidoreductase [Adlercreutzia sp. R7]